MASVQFTIILAPDRRLGRSPANITPPSRCTRVTVATTVATTTAFTPESILPSTVLPTAPTDPSSSRDLSDELPA
ncbi:unnamed protein product [Caenorhabditis auriculariae]|uniref:Uncharacterized protein n=1 Tax=Caenorhabditis auriculariae TaxID=2777116 RepID=A0A8S1HQU6_9PELO|nr:unnamed protein product [Caenorhabditis auriculariae]